MAEKKNQYTQKMFYEEVMAAMADNENVVAMCKKKLEQLDNKSSKVDTKKTEAQETIMEAIRDVLAEAPNPMQCGAIYKDERVSAVATSTQQVSAMLKKMVDCGDVVKTIEKKVTYFALA